MLRRMRAYIAHEQGQTMAEYAVVLSVVSLATLAVFGLLSGGMRSDLEGHRRPLGGRSRRRVSRAPAARPGSGRGVALVRASGGSGKGESAALPRPRDRLRGIAGR